MILLVGKTASGKNTVRDELVKKGYKPIVTYTTRPKREGEINDVTYHYISKFKFLLMKLFGKFAESTSYKVANGETWYYGTAKKDLTESKSVLIVNPNGLRAIKKVMGKKEPIFAVYLKTNNATMKQRLLKRGDNIEEAKRRISADGYDFLRIEKDVDFVICNNINESIQNIAFHIINEYNFFVDKFFME